VAGEVTDAAAAPGAVDAARADVAVLGPRAVQAGLLSALRVSHPRLSLIVLPEAADLVGTLATSDQARAAVLRLPADVRSAQEGRRFADDTLDSWGLLGTHDTRLAVNELVTNAVVHARSACELTLRLRPYSVRVEVHDDLPEGPTLLPQSASRTSGRGLSLVGAVSLAWGVEPDATGKLVWADVPRPA